jgi:hypothetical protein
VEGLKGKRIAKEIVVILYIFSKHGGTGQWKYHLSEAQIVTVISTSFIFRVPAIKVTL